MFNCDDMGKARDENGRLILDKPDHSLPLGKGHASAKVLPGESNIGSCWMSVVDSTAILKTS
jgi:hypothetical protein